MDLKELLTLSEFTSWITDMSWNEYQERNKLPVTFGDNRKDMHKYHKILAYNDFLKSKPNLGYFVDDSIKFGKSRTKIIFKNWVHTENRGKKVINEIMIKDSYPEIAIAFMHGNVYLCDISEFKINSLGQLAELTNSNLKIDFEL